MTVKGNVDAFTTTGNATGVSVRSPGAGQIYVGGYVTADAAGTAKGVFLYGGSDTVTLMGNVSASAANGNAYGVYAKSGGTIDITAHQNVYAYSRQADAYGLHLTINGTTEVDGDVFAKSYNGDATGVYLHNFHSAGLTVGGNVHAYSAEGDATGVLTYGYTGADTVIDGHLLVQAYNGYATGVSSSVYGGADRVSITGFVTVVGTEAVGVNIADAGVDNTVSVTAAGNVVVSASGNATGVHIATGGYAYVSLAQDLRVESSEDVATGVFGNTAGGGNFSVGGDVTIRGNYGAYGFDLHNATSGAVSVNVGGNIDVHSDYGLAEGVRTETAGSTSVNIDVTGNVTAKTLEGGDAFGINAYGCSTGAIDITVGGAVYAGALYGNATGVRVFDLNDDNAIDLDSVTVKASYYATGVTSHTSGNVTISVTHDVYARSYLSDAMGVYAKVGAGSLASVTVGGNVVAKAYGYATGVDAYSGGDANVAVTGDVKATSSNEGASGVYVFAAGNATATVGGNVLVTAYYGAYGMTVHAYAGDAYAGVTGNVQVISANAAARGVNVGIYNKSGTDGTAEANIGGHVYVSGYTANGVTVTGDAEGLAYVGGYVHAVAQSYAQALQVSGNQVVVDIKGSIGAKSYDAAATGAVFFIGSGGALSTIALEAGVTANAYELAKGVVIYNDSAFQANITGDVSATSTDGVATAVTLGADADGNTVVSGNVAATGTSATGFQVNALTGDQSITVDGNITANGDAFEASGVAAVLTGNSSLSVDVGQNVSAIGDTGAYGFLVSGNTTGNVSIAVTGQIYAYTETGNATGVRLYNLQGATDTVDAGSVVAIAPEGNAFGVSAADLSGNLTIDITGDLYAHAATGNATGIYVDMIGNLVATIGGNVLVKAENTAFGLDAKVLAGTAYANVDHNVTVISTSGDATGAHVYGYYGATTEVGGNVIVKAAGNATGIETFALGGFAYSEVGGDVYANAAAGKAVGVVSDGESAGVHVGGSVYAYGHASAYGVEVFAELGLATAYDGGDVTTIAKTGESAAVIMRGGSIHADFAGNLSATTSNGFARGLYAGTTDGATSSYVNIYGNVSAVGTTAAMGMELKGVSQMYADVTGDITATAPGGFAQGAVIDQYANAVYLTVGGNITALGGSAEGVESDISSAALYLTVDGGVSATGTSSGAWGIEVNASGASPVTLDVTHGVSAVGATTAYAIKVEGGTTGNIAIDVGGQVYAYAGSGNAVGVRLGGDYGATDTIDAGSVTAIAPNGAAFGIQIGGPAAGNVSSNVVIDVTHDIYAHAATGSAYGIDVTIVNDGNLTTTVGGNVRVKAQNIAYGVYANVTEGTANVTISGNLTAISTGGYAYGADVRGRYGAYVGVNGNVAVTAPDNASGVIVTSGNGTAYAKVGGDVYVKSGLEGLGVSAYSGGNDANISVAKNVYVYGAATAEGVAAYSNGGNAHIYVGGYVTAKSDTDFATAVFAHGNIASVDVKGDVTADSFEGTATGVLVNVTYGGATVDVGGNIVAYAPQATATGLSMTGAAPLAANVTGNVTAEGFTYATGAEFISYNAYGAGANVNAYFGGDVSAQAKYGAVGIDVVQNHRYHYGSASAYITVAGNVSATASQGAATGIALSHYSYGNPPSEHVSVAGDVTAFTVTGNATGVDLGNDVDAYLTVGGNVSATTTTGTATGVQSDGYAAGQSQIDVTGNVSARTAHGYATAIYVRAGGYSEISVGQNVSSISTFGSAVGLKINGSPDAYSAVSGNVTVYAGGATARGVYLLDTGVSTTTVGGDINADAPNGKAYGFVALGGQSANLTVGGNVIADGYFYAVGVKITTNDSDIAVTGSVGAYAADGNAIGVSAHDLDYTHVNVGGDVRATGLTAYGLDVAAGYGNVSVTGNVVATASFGQATGMRGNFRNGQVSYVTLGNVAAYATTSTATGVWVIGQQDDIQVSGNVLAQSNGGSAVGVYVGDAYHVGGGYTHLAIGGDVGAYGKYGTTGVELRASYFTASITGNVTAIATDGAATGLDAVDDGNAYVYVGGNVYAKATGTAQGANLFGENGVSITIAGDVTARSSDLGAFGVVVGDNHGAASVVVEGNVLAVSAASRAIGVGGYVYGPSAYFGVGGDVTANGVSEATGVVLYARNSDDAIVHVTGNVTAYASKGDATGVRIVSDAYTYIGGNAMAMTPTGNATAVSIDSAGYAGVHVGHNVYADAPGDAAKGLDISADGETDIYVGGNIHAVGNVSAYGALVKGNVSVSIDVQGDVYARATGAGALAAGVYSVNKSGSNDVYVGGNVTAIAFGYAQGVNVSGGAGYGNVTVKGGVFAASYDDRAWGVIVEANGGVTVDVDHSVTAIAYYSAQGVLAQGNGTVTVTVADDVTAQSSNFYADGVKVSAGADGVVSVGGNVTALAGRGYARGIVDSGNTSASVTVGGDVYANARNGVAVAVDVSTSGGASSEASAKISGDVTAIARVKPGFGGTYGDATGVMLTGGTGYLDVGGNVLAHAYGASAIGVDIYTTGNTTADVHGNVTAIANGYAMGIHAFTGNVTIDVGGNVYASTGSGPSTYYDTATGVFVNTTLGSGVHSANVTVGGNVTAISGDAAHGVNIDASGAVDLHVGGDVLAASTYATAYGVSIFNQTGADGAYVTGNVSALARESAVGVYLSDQGGSADVEIGKNVYADSTLGAAAGVNEDAADNTKLNVGGNILVKALQFYATGIADEAQGNATVTVGGNITVLGLYGAIGADIGGVGGTDIVIHGDVYAKGGFALGVAAYALGNQYVEIDGDVTALATTAGATGVDIVHGANDTIVLKGNVTAIAAAGNTAVGSRGERGRQCDDQHNRPDLRVRPLRLRRLCRQRDRRDARHHHRRCHREGDRRQQRRPHRGHLHLLNRRDHDQHPRRLYVGQLQRWRPCGQLPRGERRRVGHRHPDRHQGL